MGALDKKIFSGVAIVSALLFVVSAVMLFANGGEVSADSNGIALYILIASGILAIVYAVALIRDRSSFVRMLSGILAAITGLLFIVVPFMGESTGTVLAATSIVAAVTIIADMLALWVSRVYGAMYVAAVLAAVDIAMGILYFAGSTQATYHGIALIAFGIWLAMSGYVSGLVNFEAAVKTREVKADQQARKSEKPHAQNKKATKKAKKPEKKVEAPAPKGTPKSESVETSASAVEESVEKPKPKVTPRPVELPKKNVQQQKVEAPAPKEEPKEEPKAEIQKAEEPKETPKTERSEGRASAPSETQKPPAKSMDDFMKKLMSSENANRVKREAPAPKEEPKEEPKAEIQKAEESKVGPAEEGVPEQTAVETDVCEVEPALVEHIAEAPEEAVEVPAEAVHQTEQDAVDLEVVPVEEPLDEEASAPETMDASVEHIAEAPVEESAREVEPAPDEAQDVVEEEHGSEEEPAEVADEGPFHAVDEESEAVEESSEPEPDWSMVSHDASQTEPVPEPVDEDPAQEPAEEGCELGESAWSDSGDIPIEDSVKRTSGSEPTADVLSEEPSDESAETISEPEESAVTPEPESVAEVEAASANVGDQEQEEELGEDLYTDYSPEAVVRRAAWNKGLRCRRGYGEYNIPVAFVKGKVAVFVDSADADTTIDADLAEQGWTVLRYDEATITDGKVQGDEIAAAVKANMRASKAAAKKKSRK